MSHTQKSVVSLAIQKLPVAFAIGVVYLGISLVAMVTRFVYDRPLNLVLVLGSPLVVLFAMVKILNTARIIRKEMDAQNSSGSLDMG